MTADLPPFLWQFRRPLCRLGGTFAIAEGEIPQDGDLIRRVATAYRRSLDTKVGPTDNIWLSYFAEQNADTHRILAHGTLDEVGRVLRDPAGSNLFWGFDGPTAFDVQRSSDPFARVMTERYTYDALTSLAEALGVVRVENPEGLREEPILAVDKLLSTIDEGLGIEVRFPNPFRGELGISTPRGIVSHRAAMALYQAWRLFELVDHNKDARILEIGAGLGRNAFFAYQLGARHYSIVDLPTTNVAQGYFLGRVLGPNFVSLYGEDVDAYVEILPSERFLSGAEQYDLVANVDSMTEFSEETALSYLTKVAGVSSKMFSLNHERNQFTFRSLLQRIHPGARVTRTPSWIRQGYVEELVDF